MGIIGMFCQYGLIPKVTQQARGHLQSVEQVGNVPAPTILEEVGHVPKIITQTSQLHPSDADPRHAAADGLQWAEPEISAETELDLHVRSHMAFMRSRRYPQKEIEEFKAFAVSVGWVER
mmetsp:Transcript_67771/g.147614  ORF Transcript_67771/g.147614 Transcript_67771/m.147614 type:complete len:120 (-) Transcript_67771:123-482(-)